MANAFVDAGLNAMLDALSALLDQVTPLNTGEWLDQLARWKQAHPPMTQPTDQGYIAHILSYNQL